MALSIGIVGLPNVGKSTLFEALTKKQVDKSNYPFATIDPNVGMVAIPDKRVDKLAQILGVEKKLFTACEFVDIAGLVKGANLGEGLGNQFLSHIRNVSAIVYVLRAFPDSHVINTRGVVDPLGEKEILETELILKDLETVEKTLKAAEKELGIGRKERQKEVAVLLKAKNFLENGQFLIEQEFFDEERKILKNFQLLTFKPRLYLLNAQDQEVSAELRRVFQKKNWQFLVMDVLDELEAAEFTNEERQSLGLPAETSLDILIKESYRLLDLVTFFTTVSEQVQAWQIKRGTKLAQAAGAIHTDFETHFVKGEVINWQDLIDAGGFARAREKGLIRTEGKDYLVQDGDVIEIKHSA